MKKTVKAAFNTTAPSKDSIPSYVRAEGALKARMEKIMEPLDRNPDQLECIAFYGDEPMLTLGDILKSAEYIPKAEQYARSHRREGKKYLADITQRQADFIARLNLLRNARRSVLKQEKTAPRLKQVG
ncbi:MAG: hypothetical protein ACAH83_17375 [Alphaproteobacteria bacterium]